MSYLSFLKAYKNDPTLPALLKQQLNAGDVADAGIEPGLLPGTDANNDFGYTQGPASVEITGGGPAAGGAFAGAQAAGYGGGGPASYPASYGAAGSSAGGSVASGGPAADYPAPGTGAYPNLGTPFVNKLGTFFANRFLDQAPLGKLLDAIFNFRGSKPEGTAYGDISGLTNTGQTWQQNATGAGPEGMDPNDFPLTDLAGSIPASQWTVIDPYAGQVAGASSGSIRGSGGPRGNFNPNSAPGSTAPTGGATSWDLQRGGLYI